MEGDMKNFSLLLVSIFIFSLTSFPQWIQVGGPLQGLTGWPSRISVVDSNVVWIAGGKTTFPKVYRTTDGWLHWDSIPTVGLPYHLTAIAAKDSVTAFVSDAGGPTSSGGNAKLYKTTDAGLNWSIIDSTGGTAGYYNDIQFSKSNPQFGIAMSDAANGLGGPYIVNKTTDGGVTWVKTNPPGVPYSYGFFYTAYAIDPQFYGFASVESFSIMSSYTTTDGGSTWYLGDSTVSVLYWGDIVFNDDKQHGVMFGNEWPNIKVTSNGGNNWVTVNAGTDINGNSTASWVSNTNVVFICAFESPTNKRVIRSDDNGLTWQQQDAPTLPIREIDNIRYGNSMYGYAITDEGYVLKSVQSVSVVPVEMTTFATSFVLQQNYPNPFNPSTKIKYSVPQMLQVEIKVYDVLGNEIVTLVNDEKPIGNYQVSFNASNLPSGVYFYQLRAGDFIETKKMMLMK